MTRRLPCPAAPGPLEGYAERFDDLFGSLAQRRGFREYVAGLLAPRDRNKTLTALAGAQHPAVQGLQLLLSDPGGIPAGSMPAGALSAAGGPGDRPITGGELARQWEPGQGEDWHVQMNGRHRLLDPSVVVDEVAFS